MAKFRQNHSRSNKGKSFTSRVISTVVALIALLFVAYSQFTDGSTNQNQRNSSGTHSTYTSKPVDAKGRKYLPKDDKSEVIHHQYYSLGYNEDYEVPNWVAYRLTEESLKAKNVPRAKRFKTDNDVDRKSAKHSDYSHSGYTRGHMAPAGDMAFSTDAMQESFFMSNMTPQTRTLNAGIWRELEENVRDWAYDNDELYIVSGPLFNSSDPKRIGKSTKVAVPDAFYKALLDIEGRKKKAIGFIIPHEKSDLHLKEYAVSVDEIEKLTGIEMFDDLMEDDEEALLEGQYDMQKWRVDKNRFNQRVKHWNNAK